MKRFWQVIRANRRGINDLSHNWRSNCRAGLFRPRTALFLVVGVAAAFSLKINADSGGDTETFTVDVAEDLATNAQLYANPTAAKDSIGRGDTFIIDGTIYPAGSLPRGTADNDPNAPGGMGKYRQRGVFTGNDDDFARAVANDPKAPAVIAVATEVFSLPNDRATIVADGLWPNAHFTVDRAVVGGTGRFRYVIGEITEENLGENKSGACNLRVRFTLKKVSNGH